MTNTRDITLVSLRKMGKTGLILHLFEELKRRKSHETLYLDIYPTANLNGFINVLATALYRSRRTFGRKMQDFLAHFRYLRPVISLDPISGQPAVTFQIVNASDAGQSLDGLFSLIEEKSRNSPLIIAIDEFQQISHYPEEQAEALLRGRMQSPENVRYIFSGNNTRLISRMFNDASRPFYQTTEMMYLDIIGPEDYTEFISHHFGRHKKKADRQVIGEMLTWTRSHTGYVQYVCNKLFETGEDFSRDAFENIKTEILAGFEPFYLEYRNLVTTPQWQLLKAIAAENGISAVNSAEFVNRHKLASASTVNRGIQSLTAKELIYNKDAKYFVYDVFFSRWNENTLF